MKVINFDILPGLLWNIYDFIRQFIRLHFAQVEIKMWDLIKLFKCTFHLESCFFLASCFISNIAALPWWNVTSKWLMKAHHYYCYYFIHPRVHPLSNSSLKLIYTHENMWYKPQRVYYFQQIGWMAGHMHSLNYNLKTLELHSLWLMCIKLINLLIVESTVLWLSSIIVSKSL